MTSLSVYLVIVAPAVASAVIGWGVLAWHARKG